MEKRYRQMENKLTQVLLCSRSGYCTRLLQPTKLAPRLLLVLLGLSLILSSCSLGDGISYQKLTPAATVQLSYPQQPPRTYDIWLENTAAYPRPYFHEAAHALAAGFDQAIQAGYVGAVVSVSLISSNSYDPGNTIESFTIPPAPLYPQLVRHHSPDPYIDAQLAKEDERVYQQKVQAFGQLLSRIRAQVRPFLKKVAELDPPVDTSGKIDVWGAFNRAAEHLQPEKRSNKYLIFVSTLGNSTWQEFIPYQGFWGAQTHVRVDWYFCTDAPSCQANTAFWQGAFRHGGAIESSFNDPAQSRILALTNRLLA